MGHYDSNREFDNEQRAKAETARQRANAVKKPTENEKPQVGGDHYRKVPGEQHWDRAYRLKLDYFQGQITKYVERWRDKNGLEDLLKAQQMLNHYIELQQGGKFAVERGIDPDRNYVGQ